MSQINKRTLAAIMAVISSASVVSPVYATPGSGVGVSGIVAGHFGEIQVNTAENKTDKWGMILKTLDATDVGADKLTLQPGGQTGWHLHPAAVFVTVTQGSITWYDGSDPVCPGHTYNAGQSFIENAYRVHNAKSSGGAQFIAIHINPTGTSGPAFRIDEPKPTNCS